MTNQIQMYYCLKFYDKHSYTFSPFVNYKIRGYGMIHRDFKDGYFVKFQDDLINNSLNRMFNGSREI